MRTRVVIAESRPELRRAIACLVASLPDMEVAGLAPDGACAVAVAVDRSPDVVVMDPEVPRLDGVLAIRQISDLVPGVRVVVYSDICDPVHVLASLDAGATGYVLWDGGLAGLADAIRSVADGEASLAPRAARVVLDERRAGLSAHHLTDRGREVLGLVAEGLPNKLIARRLDISEKTVKAHLTGVFHSIAVDDRTQAALWARRHGIGRG